MTPLGFNLSATFIARPIATILLTLAILLCIVAGTVLAWRARSRAQA